MIDKSYIVELPQLNGKYLLKVTPIDNGKGYWDFLDIQILDRASNEVLGEYRRNYGSLYDTFYPFEQNGKYYALYSPKYTATRVMSLPNCKDICGEEPNSFGFCPTGFYVPAQEDNPSEYDSKDMRETVFGKVGFVCGCVWGDDTSWKVQYLDLSHISEGKLVRDARFGYLELPEEMKLKDAIRFWCFEKDYPTVEICTKILFPLNRNVTIDFSNLIHDYFEEERDY